MSDVYKFPCPNCAAELQAEPSQTGRRAACWSCEQRFEIPSPDTPEPSPPTPITKDYAAVDPLPAEMPDTAPPTAITTRNNNNKLPLILMGAAVIAIAVAAGLLRPQSKPATATIATTTSTELTDIEPVEVETTDHAIADTKRATTEEINSPAPIVANISRRSDPAPGKSADSANSKPRPNVVIIVANEYGQDWAPFEGSVETKTPILDALQKESLRFDKVWASPHATVSHATLLTGKYPFHHGLKSSESQIQLADHAPLPSRLQELGYQTAIAGRWPIGSQTDAIAAQHAGFAEQKLFSPDTYSEAALQAFVQSVVSKKNTPFFLYLPLVRPETTDRAAYKKQVSDMEATVAGILKSIDAAGVRNNTAVIFTSDSGSPIPGKIRVPGMKRPTGVKPTKAMPPASRGTLTNLGVHVPFLIRVPFLTEQRGRWSNDLVDFTDLVPTILELIGEKPTEGLDGQSFVDSMQGKENPFNKRNWMLTQSGDTYLIGDWAFVYRSDKRLHSTYYDPHFQTNMLEITHNDKSAATRGERLEKILARITDGK